MKIYARSLESMTYKTIVLRGRNGEPKRERKIGSGLGSCYHSPTGEQSLFMHRKLYRVHPKPRKLTNNKIFLIDIPDWR